MENWRHGGDFGRFTETGETLTKFMRFLDVNQAVRRLCEGTRLTGAATATPAAAEAKNMPDYVIKVRLPLCPGDSCAGRRPPRDVYLAREGPATVYINHLCDALRFAGYDDALEAVAKLVREVPTPPVAVTIEEAPDNRPWTVEEILAREG